MKISVIIPCYNMEQYLADAIESVIDQTKKPHEVIVIDDGSTDNSKEIAERYKDVKVISQANKGLASARNTGLMNATGDYILPLDADDIFMENMIEVITKVAKETKADIIAPSFKQFGRANNPIILMPNPKLEDFKQGNRVAYCTAVKREVLLSVGGWSPRMNKGYEDYHLWFNLLTKGHEITTIQEPLFLYRVREGSMITDSVKYHNELMAQINKDFKIYD